MFYFFSFSQLVSLDISGNFTVNNGSGLWELKYKSQDAANYTAYPTTITNNSVKVKLNPFVNAEFSTRYYNYGWVNWSAPVVYNNSFSAVSKNIGYTYDFNSDDIVEGWRGYRLQNSTSTYHSNIQEIANNGGESLYLGWIASKEVILVSPKITDLATDKKFSFKGTGDTNNKIILGTITDPYDPNTFHPLKTVTFSYNMDPEIVVFMNNYVGNDQYIAVKSTGNIGDVYLDDFKYEQSVNCFDISNLTVSDISQSSAIVSFDADVNQSSWELNIKDLTHNITETRIINQNPYVLENLAGNTIYEVKIRAICDVGLYSNWTVVNSFSTVCESINSGYATSFLETNFIDPCWSTKLNNSYIYQATTATNIGVIPRSGTKYIQMYNSSTVSSQLSFFISPYINDLDVDKRIKFYLISKGEAFDYNTNPLIIGTMSDPNNENTFVPISSISPLEMNEINGFQVSDNWKQHIVYLENYDINLNHHYIAFKQGNIKSSFFIDDFLYEPIPICKEPIYLKTIKTNYDSVIVSWEENDLQNSNEWEIEYGPFGFEHGSGTILTVSTNPFTIADNLNEDTEYNFYVRSKCGLNGNSDWSDKGYFKTRCFGVYSGYETSFEINNIENNTSCWRKITPQIRQSYYNANQFINSSSTTYFKSGTKSVIMNNLPYSPETDENLKNILVTPRLIGFDNFKRISFWVRPSGNLKVVVGTLSDPDDYTTFESYTTFENLNYGVWNEIIVDFSSYSGTNDYVGIRYDDINNSYLHLDDFKYIQNTCTRPSNLQASQVNDSSVTLSWEINNSVNPPTSWEIEYGEDGFIPGTGTVITVSSNPYVLQNLESFTNYEYRVRNICDNSIVNWSDFYSFKISCYVDSPFVEKFDQYNATNTINLSNFCWTTNVVINQGLDVKIIEKFVNNYTSSPNCIFMYNNSLTEDTYLISPYISDFDANKKLKFWVIGDNRSIPETISVGTIKNPLDLSTYEEYEQINLENLPLNGKEIYVDFGNYTGDNKMFVIKLPHIINSFHSFGVAIDNFIFDNKNGCKEPVNIQFSQITNNSTKIKWDTTFGANVSIEYGIQGFSLGNGITVNSNLNEVLITGLTESNAYEFYFTTNCNQNDSVVVGPIVLNTTCIPFSLPWSEDFNNLPQYGTNILPECFKFISGNFRLKDTSVFLGLNSNNFYEPDHLMNGYNDSTYINFLGAESAKIVSPVFNLMAGTTYKFSLQARKAYEYSGMHFPVSVGRGHEDFYMESTLERNGSITEYNYSEMDYYYTPLESGVYSYLIDYSFVNSTSMIVDNLELNEGYTNIVTNSNEVFDFENGINNKLLLESTENNSVLIQTDVSNNANNVLFMSGGEEPIKWKNTQNDIWLNNQDFINKVNFKINTQNMSQLYLRFDLKQTYTDLQENSMFRVVVNGNIIGSEIMPIANQTDMFQTYQFDLNSYIGQDIRVSLQHLGKSSSGIGDSAFIDNIELGNVLNSEQFFFDYLTVYPNPSKDIIYVKNKDIIDEYEIMNISGQVLEMKIVNLDIFEINIEEFSSGVYFLKLNSENNFKTIKVVKE